MVSSLPRIDPESVLGYRIPEGTFSYTERDVALYALGVGACTTDPCDPSELSYVYSQEGQDAIKILPTFPVLFSFGVLTSSIPGLNYIPSKLLHGEQYLEIYKQLPTNAQVVYQARVSGLHDKGKAAVAEIETICRDSHNGDVLCMGRSTLFLRGAGGFSKSSSKPYSYSNRSPSIAPIIKLPVRPSESVSIVVHEEKTHLNQALLYRLSGDYNPLHSDPEIAKIAGFERPILHGLCTLGFAVRAVIKRFCNGEPSLVRAVQARFMLHVFPGETLITKMWTGAQVERVCFECMVKERDSVVLSGVVSLLPPARL